ncbi:Homeodomain [Penicillium soppii]|uniref:Homeodomain n=1 Tax=Penicillium soppii TaxID=69789 RepID=UPI002548AEC4|nr:Homeodomain [Penicillium soppii]KAJ5871726.1 Homeodomain [Penicillium soppii]
MNPQHPTNPWQLPRSLSDTELERILDESGQPWLEEDVFDSNPFDSSLFALDPYNLEWSQWMSRESHETQMPGGGLEPPDPQIQTPCISHDPGPSLEGNINLFAPQSDLANVSQWLDGAYRPPVSCSYCRRHRLQCLIIRTTSANPNPKTSCSSCVALFRECSLARGEKRLPSGFETLSPVLGHLHGVPEDETAITEKLELGDERKEPKQFIRKGARVLREWFYQNQECPYPTEAQKNQLSLETGFSPKRLSTWFANARRRQKQKLQSSGLASTSRTRASSPMVKGTLASLTPMERWQASPPDDEPVPEAAIQNAIMSGSIESEHSFDPFQLDGSRMDMFNFDESSSHLATSVSSVGSKASETSESGSSAWSHHSSGETGLSFQLSKPSKPKRIRGRQRPSGNYQYRCTFCAQSFKKKHDWSRHEKSVHLALDSWVCTPNLNNVQQSFDLQSSECAFCDVLFPTPAHWEEHEFNVCVEKPVQERTFSRKDYLWQHLRKFHSCTKPPVPDLDAWRGSGTNVQSRCGFCGCSLSTWPARAEHLAEHFKKGSQMDEWEGDWGLDASTMSVLRNAVLPSQRLASLPT